MRNNNRILIVDDTETDREMYRRCLEKGGFAGWTIVESEDGADALAQYRAVAFDLVLLDYSLPGRTGIDLLKDFREDQDYAPVVIITGQGNEGVAIDCMKNGAQDYLVKGEFSAESFLHAVRNALERIEMQKKIARQYESLKNFSHVLAHDLKAPIKRMYSLSDIISDSVERKQYETVDRFFGEVRKSAVLMDELIDALNAYNSLDAADVAFDCVDMQTVFGNLMSIAGTEIEEKRAKVTCDGLPVVRGNAAQLTQLLQNLVLNGIKYSRSDVPTVHVAAAQVDGEWRISVRDNGIGIDCQYFRRIFEPFKRLHGSDEFSGSGLGLATCKRIVDAHGGRIWCESDLGVGTTFHFTLPVPERAAEEKPLVA